MELDLKKSFFIQHWEFIVLFITIVYFISKLRNGNQKSSQSKSQRVNNDNDDEVIASDYQKDDDEDNEELTPALEDVDHVVYNGVQVKLKGGANEFFAMANDRRSIRMFSNKPVDIEVVKKCILAAGTSPSGAHTEPWTYCLVKEWVTLINCAFEVKNIYFLART